jgi:type IV pilus assembly protein PilE
MIQATTPPTHDKKSPRGLTLIELLVVMAVIAILAAIATPSFLDSIRKGRRTEATAALTQVQQAQERWRSNQASYTTALTASAPAGLGLTSSTPEGRYTVSIDDASASGYTTTAAAVSGTSQSYDTTCTTMRLRLDGGNIQYGGCSGCAVPVGVLSDPNRCWSR